MREDPLLDWLGLFGEANGFQKGRQDVDTSLSAFLWSKGRDFERRVVDFIRAKCEVVEVEPEYDENRNRLWWAELEKTKHLIGDGPEVIYQATVADEDGLFYGRPDLLVRTDALPRIVGCSPDLEVDHRHYVVVDIKYSSGKLKKKTQTFVNDKHKLSQALIYNQCLAAMQGFPLRYAYLLFRSIKDCETSDGCFARLAPVDTHFQELNQSVTAGANWIRRLRDDGANWSVLPSPSVEELRPNMGNTQDEPWHDAKKQIGEQLRDLTQLWYVTPNNRPRGIAVGVTRWDDDECCASLFGLTEDRTEVLQAIIDVQKPDAPSVSPERIATARDEWHPKAKLEFFVDFETVSNLDDDFSTFPVIGGTPLIFMIGCGYEKDDEWKFDCFIVDRLSAQSEAEIITKWVDHMARICTEYGVSDPRVFHWSPAEQSALTTSFQSARNRHPEENWPEPNWFDFLNAVVKKEPVVVKGALAFGLKAFANALYSHDLIRTHWTSSRIDGLGAMVGAWNCEHKCTDGGCLMDFELMKEIRDYNEIDCKVMWEAVNYLRANH
jgi:predicted RecB family nuclease